MPNTHNEINGMIGRVAGWPEPPAEREWDNDSNESEHPLYRLTGDTDNVRIIPDTPPEEHFRVAASGASMDFSTRDAHSPERHDAGWAINHQVTIANNSRDIISPNATFTPISFNMADASWKETFGWAVSWMFAPLMIIWSKIIKRSTGLQFRRRR